MNNVLYVVATSWRGTEIEIEHAYTLSGVAKILSGTIGQDMEDMPDPDEHYDDILDRYDGDDYSITVKEIEL